VFGLEHPFFSGELVPDFALCWGGATTITGDLSPIRHTLLLNED
jgi:hypothetical protein